MQSGMRNIKMQRITVALLLVVAVLMSMAMPTSAANSNVVVMITGSGVNIRSGAGTNFSSFAKVALGSRFGYLGETTGTDGAVWYNIQYSSSKTGWVSGTYSVKVTEDDSVQAYINSIASSYGAVGAQVAVIDNGVVTDTYNYGYATKGSVLMGADTKIRVASLSKIFVAMEAMKLQESGVINVDANIGPYWGTTIPKAVTMRSLLSHSSTLKVLTSKSTKAATLSQIRSSSSYNSGTVGASNVWCYNNYAVGVAGSTLEVANNKTLDAYADEQFFASLGIDAAWAGGKVNRNQLATLYYANDTVARTVSYAASVTGSEVPGDNAPYFAGGLIISAKDMAKLIAILANDGSYNGVQYLTPESVATIEQKLFTASENGGSFSQCMPLRYKANLYGQNKLYYHTGNAYGVLALASYNPTTKDGVVVITTGASAGRDSQGVYAVCSKITEYMYSVCVSSTGTTATTTTTTTVPTTTTTTVPAIPATVLSITEQNVAMKLGETRTLTVLREPADATDTLTWSSSDPCVRVDSSGTVYADRNGTAIITVRGYNTEASCTVTVTPDISMTMLGASIRISDPYGIRFGVQLNKNYSFKNSDITEYGTLMIGSGTLGDAELLLDTPSANRVKAVNIFSEDNEQITYTGVLVNIPESFFGTNVTARGYLVYRDYNGQEHVVYTDTVTKSFDGVARAAYDSYSSIQSPTEEQRAVIGKLAQFISA